jgi:hypothetical protein
MLTLHTLSIYGQSEIGPDVKISNALDILNVALKNFARRWQFAQNLLGMSKVVTDFLAPFLTSDRLSDTAARLELAEVGLLADLVAVGASTHAFGSVEARTCEHRLVASNRNDE